MGTRLGVKTPYQAIPHFSRGLKVYSVKNMNSLDELLMAMRTWNLHGSADKIEHWKEDMKAYEHYEWFSEPLGVWDWDDMDEAFRQLR